MALQIWLPLNKDVRNIGLFSAVCTDYSTTHEDTGGLFGGCTKFSPEASSAGNNYISIQHKTSEFMEDDSSFTIAAFVKITGSFYSNGAGIFGANAYQTSGIGISVTSSRGVMLKICYGTSMSQLTGNAVIPTNEWHHVCVVYKKEYKKAYFYLDGVLDTTKSVTSPWVNHRTQNILIGKGSQGGWGYTFPGYIQDFRIYNNALTLDDIKELNRCNAMDICASNYYNGFYYDNGTMALSGFTTSNVVFSGSSMYFNGSNSKINVDARKISGGTLSIWFNTDRKSTQFFYADSTSHMGFTVYSSTSVNSRIIPWIGSGSKKAFSSSLINWGHWNHAAVVFNNVCEPTACYINGQQAEEYGTDFWTGTADGSVIGCRPNNSLFYKGYINEIKIYTKQLGEDDIKALYSKGLRNKMSLPDGFVELEYIESNGSSYFNTGSKFNPETDSFKAIFKGNDTSNNGMVFASNSGKYFWLYYYSAGINIYSTNSAGTQKNIIGPSRDLNKHEVEYTNKTYFIDGIRKGTFTDAFIETSYNIYLFAYNNANTNYGFKGRIYYADIRRNGVLTKMFIPAKRLSDNAVGMYDPITNAFFVSESTTPFTAGPTI